MITPDNYKMVTADRGVILSTTETEFYENLLKVLECPVCYDYMMPPIVLCTNGHSLCETCKSKTEMCPVCRNEFLSDGRNFCLEQMTTKLLYPCRNRVAGCQQFFTLDTFAPHQESCPYRLLSCFVSGCATKWKGRHHQLWRHAKSEHPNKAFEMSEGSLTLSIPRKKVTHLSVLSTCDEIFWMHSKRSGGSFYFAVQFVKRKLKPGFLFKYRCEYEVSDGKGSWWGGYSRPVHIEAEEPYNIMKKGNCFELGGEVLKQFGSNSEILFKLYIEKIKQ